MRTERRLPAGRSAGGSPAQNQTAGGLAGATVADIALNGVNSRIYAAVYGSGIYVSNTR